MSGKNIVQKILEAHNISKKPITDYELGDPIFVTIDQCITQDATGTMAWWLGWNLKQSIFLR